MSRQQDIFRELVPKDIFLIFYDNSLIWVSTGKRQKENSWTGRNAPLKTIGYEICKIH